MLVVIMITGILLGVQALKCNQCTDIDYDSSNDGIKTILDTMTAGMGSCDSAAADCPMGSDECAANIISYKIEYGSNEFAVSQVMKLCSSSAVDGSTLCDAAESQFDAMGSVVKDVKCKTETCSTDGCNTQTATASATDLSISFFLFASIAIAMFD
jgi:hypothetical protein